MTCQVAGASTSQDWQGCKATRHPRSQRGSPLAIIATLQPTVTTLTMHRDAFHPEKLQLSNTCIVTAL